MSGWQTWKRGFVRWEGSAATALEELLAQPTLVRPAGSLLALLCRAKILWDRSTGLGWHLAGLVTREDADHLRHGLNQLESRLLDLEERLDRGGAPGASQRNED